MSNELNDNMIGNLPKNINKPSAAPKSDAPRSTPLYSSAASDVYKRQQMDIKSIKMLQFKWLRMAKSKVLE